jgi:hypothetical protein
MTIIYFLRVVGVLLVFSEKLAHVVPIEDRTGYLWHYIRIGKWLQSCYEYIYTRQVCMLI